MPLYKGQVGGSFSLVEGEIVLFSEVTNVLSLWEVECTCERLSSSQRYYHWEVGTGVEVVLFSEVTNVLSLWEVGEVVLFSEVTNVGQLVLCSETFVSFIRGSHFFFLN